MSSHPHEQLFTRTSLSQFSNPSLVGNECIRQYMEVNRRFSSDEHGILSELSFQVSNFLKEVEKEIIQLVNVKKNDFFAVGSKLDKIGRQIEAISASYIGLLQYYKGVNLGLGETMQRIESVLINIKGVVEEQRYLAIYTGTEEMLGDCWRLLNSLKTNTIADKQLPILERISLHLSKDIENRDKFTTNHPINLNEKHNLQKLTIQVNEFISKYLEILNTIMKDIIKQEIPATKIDLYLSYLLRCYKNCNQQGQIYSILRNEILSPESENLMERMKENKLSYFKEFQERGDKLLIEDERREPPNIPLQVYLDGMRECVESGVISKIMEITSIHPEYLREWDINNISNINNYVSGYEVAHKCIWEFIMEELNTKYNSIYSGAIPHLLHDNYKVCLQFMLFLVHLDNGGAPLSTEGGKLGDGSMGDAMIKFLAKFDLRTYFQLLYKEVSLKVEGLILINECNFESHIYPIIRQIFSHRVFVQRIGGKYIGLTFQIINRYLKHKIVQITLDGQGVRDQGEEDNQLKHIKGAGILQFIQEINRMEELVSRSLIPLLIHSLDLSPLTSQALHTHLQTLTQETKSQISKLINPAFQELKDETTALILVNVSNLRSVVSNYRMTNKTISLQASHFVSGLFSPLFDICNNSMFDQLMAHTKEEFISQILEIVFTKMENIIQEIVSEERKMEESLKRFKIGENKEGMKDLEKIMIQFYIDVKACENTLKDNLQGSIPWNNLNEIYNLLLPGKMLYLKCLEEEEDATPNA